MGFGRRRDCSMLSLNEWPGWIIRALEVAERRRGVGWNSQGEREMATRREMKASELVTRYRRLQVTM